MKSGSLPTDRKNQRGLSAAGTVTCGKKTECSQVNRKVAAAADTGAEAGALGRGSDYT